MKSDWSTPKNAL